VFMDPATVLKLLADYDFSGRNEAEIRGDWIEPLLVLLGYGLGTRHRILREEQLRLQPPIRMIGSSRHEIDFTPTVFGERLWIIEAKKPQDDLFAMEHLGQAWSYATDPRIRVPLMMLCDGTRIAVFDVTQVEWDTPVYDRAKADLVATFDELFGILGAPRVAEAIRVQQLGYLKQALQAQVDLAALDATLTDVAEIVKEARPIVIARREEIRREARDRLTREGDAAVDKAGMWGHAQKLNGPHWFRQADVDRAVELVLRQSPLNRRREFDDFERSTTPTGQAEPRMWFPLRVVRMATAVRLIEAEGCGDYCREVAETAARQHSDGFADDPLLAQVYRLQRILGPCGWRIAALSKSVIDKLAKETEERLEVEEWLRIDGAIGITATDNYLRAARLGPIMIQVKIDPWDEPTVRKFADETEVLLAKLPKPAEFKDLQPAGDPWLDSWLRDDQLRAYSKIQLTSIADRNESDGVREFARELLRFYRA
jgi:hypothetical protein